MVQRICALLNLAIYLESNGDFIFSEESKFLFCNGIDGDRSVRGFLNKITLMDEFIKIGHGKIGTHSFRKGVSTYCSRNGLSNEDINYRGRWRDSTKQINTYIDINRPYPDARVSSCLCGHSGPAFYFVENSDWFTENFVSTHIVPNIAKLLGVRIAKTLSLSLVHASTHPLSSCEPKLSIIPDCLRKKVLNALRMGSGGLYDEKLANIVKKKPLLVNGQFWHL